MLFCKKLFIFLQIISREIICRNVFFIRHGDLTKFYTGAEYNKLRGEVMEIYADVLFFINFISTYVMVDLTGRIAKNKPKQLRIIMSAAAGAILSVFMFLGNNFWVLLKIINAIFVPVIAFWRKGHNVIFEIIFFFVMSLIVSVLFAFLASYKISDNINIKNGIIYFDIPIFRFIMIFAISYFLVFIADNILKRRKVYIKHIITITHNQKSVLLTALCDSGNMLKEPVTGRDVIVCEWESVKGLFDGINYEEFINDIEKYRLWLIPYHSLGRKNAYIEAFLADRADIENEKRCIGKVFVAVTDEKLSASGEYNALVGVSL